MADYTDMTRLELVFESLRKQGSKALIPFVMGGYPDLRTTGQLLLALEDAGADVIEVGIPFSDPLADGPVIQVASARALASGATPARVLDAVCRVRSRLRVPVVCLSYWNPIMQFGHPSIHNSDSTGVRLFIKRAVACGFSGLIVPDLPVEEAQGLVRVARNEPFATVFIAAPTSPPDRLRAIARFSEGFIYYVSVTGTTGARRVLAPSLVHGVRQLKLLTTKPVCVGFGISTPAQAREVARVADGVIIGSALIEAIGRSNSRAAARSAAFLRRFRAVL